MFSSMTSRSRSISTCVKAALHIVKFDFELSDSISNLYNFITSFTAAVDNSTICTNRLLFFLCGILSLSGVVV